MPKDPYYPSEWETVYCPICNHQEAKVYEKYGDELQFTYVQCYNCSLIYQSPRPKYGEAYLDEAYSDYELWHPNHLYGVSRYEDFGAEVEEILNFDKEQSAVLDVGCAMGDFLYFAKKYYATSIGLEIADNMSEYARRALQIPVLQEDFISYQPGIKFSCIHMSHIIEHIPNPNEWLEKARKLLTGQGILVICVPNYYSPGRRIKLLWKNLGIKKGKWKEIGKTPDHLFEPTLRSFRYFFKKNQFEIIHYYTYSRKDMTAKSKWHRFYYRTLGLGANFRFYVKPINKDLGTATKKQSAEALESV